MKTILVIMVMVAGLFAAPFQTSTLAADEATADTAAPVETNAPATEQPAAEDGTAQTPQPPDENAATSPAPTADSSADATNPPAETALPADSAPVADSSSRTPASSPATSPQPKGMRVRRRAMAVDQTTNMLATDAVAAADIASAGSTNSMNGTNGLRLNFRGVPLEMVLNYLSDAAGFIINPKTDVSGKVTIWSAQPLTKDEAVKLLKTVLNDSGYTVIQNGRMLTIIRSSEAKTQAPVITSDDPNSIPATSDIVVQIVPVHTLNVVQLVKTLELFKPSTMTITSDESANSLAITDTQENVKHIVEIVHALDNVTSSSATIRVFSLRYADSKSLASLIKDLFPSADTQGQGGGGGRGGFGRMFRGGGGGFGGFGGFGGGGDTGSTESNGHTPTAKVNAVSDDHSNSLIVSAPDSLINDIAELVKEVDVPVDAVTEMQVFKLKNADPTEMANLITSMYPNESSSSDASRSSPFPFFGRFGGGGGGRQQQNSSDQSPRAVHMAQVIAQADPRTSSVIVTAGKDVMPQITEMVAELDKGRDKIQTAYVIPLKNADPQDIITILQQIYPASTVAGRSPTSTSSQASPLATRASTLLQQQNSQQNTSFGGAGQGNSGTSGRGF